METIGQITSKYRHSLENQRVSQRFKFPVNALELFDMYVLKVNRSGFYLRDEVRIQVLCEKVAKWLTGDYKTSLMLYGTIGSGKTTMLDSMVELLRNKGFLVTALSAVKLNEIIIERPDSFDWYRRCPILAIDDVGVQTPDIKHYANTFSPFATIIEERYKKKLITMISSNLSDQPGNNEFAQHYGARIADRMKEMFDKIYYDSHSYRQ